MKIGVLGAGLMGTEAARDLVNSDKVREVGIADFNQDRVEKAKQRIQSEKLTGYQVDARNENELRAYLKRFDVVINALFYTFNEVVVRTGIDVGTSVVDLGGHIGGVTTRVLDLHEEAKDRGVTIIPDLGVAPGMINIITGYGAGKLDEIGEIRIFVGGIPVHPEPPLGYNHVFSLEGMLDHYTDASLIIRDGRERMVPSLTEVEPIYFERFGRLEAFHTAGGTSTLPKSYENVDTLEYKTIRYPGHAEQFQLLVDLNLTKRDYKVDIHGTKINPRDVLLRILDPLTELGEKEDVVLFRAIISGKKEGQNKTYQYDMQTFKDTSNEITAMARVTASTISIVAQLIADQTIKKHGAYPPEKIVPGERYMKELLTRKIEIRETEQ